MRGRLALEDVASLEQAPPSLICSTRDARSSKRAPCMQKIIAFSPFLRLQRARVHSDGQWQRRGQWDTATTRGFAKPVHFDASTQYCTDDALRGVRSSWAVRTCARVHNSHVEVSSEFAMVTGIRVACNLKRIRVHDTSIAERTWSKTAHHMQAIYARELGTGAPSRLCCAAASTKASGVHPRLVLLHDGIGPSAPLVQRARDLNKFSASPGYLLPAQACSEPRRARGKMEELCGETPVRCSPTCLRPAQKPSIDRFDRIALLSAAWHCSHRRSPRRRCQ